jgi:hypothetical protein
MIGKGDYAYAVPFYGESRPILIDIVLMPQKEIEDKYDYVNRCEKPSPPRHMYPSQT